MLGIRLSQRDEDRLERHALQSGRGKSVIAREWIIDRLEREEMDRKIRDAALLHAGERGISSDSAHDAATNAWLRALDAEDGGYDWGPDGPPDIK